MAYGRDELEAMSEGGIEGDAFVGSFWGGVKHMAHAPRLLVETMVAPLDWAGRKIGLPHAKKARYFDHYQFPNEAQLNQAIEKLRGAGLVAHRWYRFDRGPQRPTLTTNATMKQIIALNIGGYRVPWQKGRTDTTRAEALKEPTGVRGSTYTKGL
jgi:hypothetical protein